MRSMSVRRGVVAAVVAGWLCAGCESTPSGDVGADVTSPGGDVTGRDAPSPPADPDPMLSVGTLFDAPGDSFRLAGRLGRRGAP